VRTKKTKNVLITNTVELGHFKISSDNNLRYYKHLFIEIRYVNLYNPTSQKKECSLIKVIELEEAVEEFSNKE
jgi:hypothetical protein